MRVERKNLAAAAARSLAATVGLGRIRASLPSSMPPLSPGQLIERTEAENHGQGVTMSCTAMICQRPLRLIQVSVHARHCGPWVPSSLFFVAVSLP